MTPAVSGPVATVTLILPAAVILNAVATHVGTITASALSDALAVAVRIEAAPEPAAVPIDTVALPAAATAVVVLNNRHRGHPRDRIAVGLPSGEVLLSAVAE